MHTTHTRYSKTFKQISWIQNWSKRENPSEIGNQKSSRIQHKNIEGSKKGENNLTAGGYKFLKFQKCSVVR